MSKRTSLIIGTFVLSFALLATEWGAEVRFRGADADILAFLDVGQGDATLLRDDEGRTVLIDAGPGDAVLEALERHLPAWERDIDLLILTHLDADHFTGAFGLLERYRIGEIWWNGAAPTTEGGRRLLVSLLAHEVPMKVVRSGEVYAFARMSLTVIHPDEDLTGTFVGDKNAESVSARIGCGEDVALLAGDAPTETEADFLDDGDIGDITLLKVSHHGSRHSTSGEFLDAVTPEYAVISSGKGNRYGHPSSRVMTDLKKRGVGTLRTDREGDVVFVCGSDGLTIRQGA